MLAAYRQRMIRTGIVLVLLAAAPVARADDAIDHVIVKPTTVYMQNDRARVVLNVTNNNREVLDIEVTCRFFDSAHHPVGTGHNVVSRLPPRRQDTLEVADEIAHAVDGVECAATNVRK
jgi:hypothetical protein